MNLERILKEQEEDARVEARYRTENVNFDNLLNILFNRYVDNHHQTPMRIHVEDEVHQTFLYMLNLNYSQPCISYYQKFWVAIKEDCKLEREYDRE